MRTYAVKHRKYAVKQWQSQNFLEPVSLMLLHNTLYPQAYSKLND